jgi:hypothetical protein
MHLLLLLWLGGLADHYVSELDRLEVSLLIFS